MKIAEIRCLAIPTVLCLIMAAHDATANPLSAVSFVSESNGYADGVGRMLGWQFTVASDPILITALGFHDFGKDGLTSSHEVGIWRLADQGLVADAVVPAGTSGALDGYFRYVALASPLELSADATYVIAGFDNGFDLHVWDTFLPGLGGLEVSGFSVAPEIQIGAPGTFRGAGASSFGYVGDGSGFDSIRSALLGPNFQYQLVPEPSTLVSALCAGLALLGWRRRSRRRKDCA